MSVICHQSRLFPSVMMASVVASDDGLHLPPTEFIIEVMDGDSYLAHEELEQFVDGSQFFPLSSSSSFVGFWSLPFSTSGIGKNSDARAITSVYALLIWI